jgi:hypothetical protein
LAEYQVLHQNSRLLLLQLRVLKWFEWKDSINTRELEFSSIQTPLPTPHPNDNNN